MSHSHLVTCQVYSLDTASLGALNASIRSSRMLTLYLFLSID
jgi:hypothetical protein